MRRWIESALGAIGITRYTNRDALMDQLDKLTADDLVKIINANGLLGDMVNHVSCSECKAANGGECVHQGDNEYCGEYDAAAWLNRTWAGAEIITKEALADG